jgi:hypothetical protein
MAFSFPMAEDAAGADVVDLLFPSSERFRRGQRADINFLLAIPFYIIAKSELYLFIFKVALGDALIKIQIYDVISPEL